MSDLPGMLSRKWGSLRFVHYVGDGEWHSECPVCRDDGHQGNSKPDRFVMSIPNRKSSKDARGWCRRCGHFEWADHNPTKPLSPQRQQQANEVRRKLAAEENQRIQSKIEWLQQQVFWLNYHEGMTKEQKKLWYRAGIGDWAITLHKLGYSPKNNGAMTIPYFEGEDIQTLQFRLMQPDEGGKYRFLKGTRPELFITWPEDQLDGVILITEGAKKGLVTFQQGPFTYQGEEIAVVSVPMKTVPERLIRKLDKADKILWLLDPDAYTPIIVNGQERPAAIDRNIKMAGETRCRILNLPGKIDDMFMSGLKPKSFQAMLNQAAPYIPQGRISDGAANTFG